MTQPTDPTTPNPPPQPPEDDGMASRVFRSVSRAFGRLFGAGKPADAEAAAAPISPPPAVPPPISPPPVALPPVSPAAPPPPPVSEPTAPVVVPVASGQSLAVPSTIPDAVESNVPPVVAPVPPTVAASPPVIPAPAAVAVPASAPPAPLPVVPPAIPPATGGFSSKNPIVRTPATPTGSRPPEPPTEPLLPSETPQRLAIPASAPTPKESVEEIFPMADTTDTDAILAAGGGGGLAVGSSPEGGGGVFEHDIKVLAPSSVRESHLQQRHAQQAPPPPRDLPLEYGDTRIRLLVRDPEWMFAYWEVNDDTRRAMGLPRGGHRRRTVIRCYNVTGRAWPEESAHYFFDVDVSPYATTWYLKVPETDQKWVAELGTFDDHGQYQLITRSNHVATPRDTVSTDLRVEWMVVEEVTRRITIVPGEPVMTGDGSGGDGGAGAVWEIGADGVRRVVVSHLGGSEAIIRTLERHVVRGLHGIGDEGSGGVGLSSGALVGASDGLLGHGGAGGVKDFWLVVNAELILYGATEPDAKVTVQGIPVKLNPDGTFSLRFALPDGEQVLTVKAVNQDGDMSRQITPIVTRRTE